MRKLHKRGITLFVVTIAGLIIIAIGLHVRLSRASELPVPPRMPADHALFTTSLHCIACHSNIHASDGEDNSIGWQWRATMMANSSRDPYWQASIRREIMDHSEAQAAVEDTCSTCHMPMERYQAHAEGLKGEVLRYLDPIRSGAATVEPEATLAEAKDPMATLAADGVSCTVCHQIRPDNFGRESSFDGGFIVDLQKKPEQRELFGQFDVDSGRTTAMHSVTGFTPTKTDHLQHSELCASCHTLFTHALDNQGNPAGILPEQVPYQEWLHSDYAQTKTCQSCHMPNITVDVPISSVLGKTHTDVPQHVFVGGNSFVLRILKDHRNELGVIAPAQELEEQAMRTEQQLVMKTAAVSIENATKNAGRLNFDVNVTNLTGHKLPTAYPARRVWLHVTVRDARGTIIFESGAPRADGSIVGNDNDMDASKFEPHYTHITSADQVQIYESIMEDYAGHVTTGLLFGTQYLKDNRLLPRGFDKASASPETAVQGSAARDARFIGGSDSLSYSVILSNGSGPYTVSVELLYQAIGFRWAQNLRAYTAPEPERFLSYFNEQANTSSKLLARDEITTKF